MKKNLQRKFLSIAKKIGSINAGAGTFKFCFAIFVRAKTISMSGPPQKPSRRRQRHNDDNDGGVSTSISRDAGERWNDDGKNEDGANESKGNNDVKDKTADKTVGFKEIEKDAPNSPSRAPPKKAPKPKFDLGGSKGLSEQEEKQEIANRSMGKIADQSFLSSLNTMLFSSYGYRMESQILNSTKLPPYSIRGGGDNNDNLMGLFAN